ncbi:hypothetical protein LJK87_05390 [Paenibacillus sp. P25]|nr:hypothetical protein LJK87_05390 [Paenibacillus sp. P25]
MFNIMITLIDTVVAWRWGDWRNWRSYHATILYFICCDLLHNVLTEGHHLWKYAPTAILPNHTLMNLFVMLIAYPSMLLVYLGRFPSGRLKQIGWISLWVALWSMLEWFSMWLGQFSYNNGWNIWWSIVFNMALFVFSRLHYIRPLLCYGLSVIAAVLLVWYFKVPVRELE